MSFIKSLFISCRDATYLHGKRESDALTFGEKLGLQFHLLICKFCRRFFNQLDEIESHTHAFSHSGKTMEQLGAPAKEKMQQAIQQQLKP